MIGEATPMNSHIQASGETALASRRNEEHLLRTGALRLLELEPMYLASEFSALVMYSLLSNGPGAYGLYESLESTSEVGTIANHFGSQEVWLATIMSRPARQWRLRYVGVSTRLIRRLETHLAGRSYASKTMDHGVEAFRFFPTPSLASAEAMELAMIQAARRRGDVVLNRT